MESLHPWVVANELVERVARLSARIGNDHRFTAEESFRDVVGIPTKREAPGHTTYRLRTVWLGGRHPMSSLCSAAQFVRFVTGELGIRPGRLGAGDVGTRPARAARNGLGHAVCLWIKRFVWPKSPVGRRTSRLLAFVRGAAASFAPRSRVVVGVAPMSVAVSGRKMNDAPYRSFETRRVIIFARGKKEKASRAPPLAEIVTSRSKPDAKKPCGSIGDMSAIDR